MMVNGLSGVQFINLVTFNYSRSFPPKIFKDLKDLVNLANNITFTEMTVDNS